MFNVPATCFMAGFLPETCMSAYRAAVESDGNKHKGWPQRRGNHVSIASNAACTIGTKR